MFRLNRNERSHWSGNGVHVESELVFMIGRNMHCIPPTHTYQGYLNAWTHFCTSQSVTDADRRIVRESVRPYSVVNPCKALK